MSAVICKLVGIKYLTASDVYFKNKQRVSEPMWISNVNAIKDDIKHLLFTEKYDSVVGCYKGQLYVFFKDDVALQTYNKTAVSYHPLQDQVKFN